MNPTTSYTCAVEETGRAALESLDPINVPRYTVPEAARYLPMPPGTLQSWVAGRPYSIKTGSRWWANLIHRPDPEDPRLSFSNLVEAFVLLAIRKQYHVKMHDVRIALDFSKNSLGVDKVLLSKDLRVAQGSIFLRRLGELINVGAGGQIAMPQILDAYLRRIEWSEDDLPLSIFPFTKAGHSDSTRVLRISPRIAFGRPVVDRKAIKTSAIAERFKAGDSISGLAEDYDLTVFEVEEAIRYEAFPIAA
jgi:uncharacterized protein (DUF433 family)